MLEKEVSKFWILGAIPIVFALVTFAIGYTEKMMQIIVWIVFLLLVSSIFYTFYFITKRFVIPFIQITVIPNKFKSTVIGLLLAITTMMLIIMVRIL